MVFELVKNSLRAVQERFMDSEKIAPPVRIIVADGLEDVTIKACISISFSIFQYVHVCLVLIIGLLLCSLVVS